jgi:hypothetical protein
MGSGSKNCTDNMQKDITRIRFFIFIKEEETLFRFKVHSSVSETSFRFVLQKKIFCRWYAPWSKDFKDVNMDPNLDHGKWVKNCTKTLAGQTDRHTVVKVIGICLYERLGIWKCTFLIGMVNFFQWKLHASTLLELLRLGLPL